MNADRKALVLFSGGQDSTACLAWALARYTRVETIGFDYGQRHKVELKCRLRVREEIRETAEREGYYSLLIRTRFANGLFGETAPLAETWTTATALAIAQPHATLDRMSSP